MMRILNRLRLSESDAPALYADCVSHPSTSSIRLPNSRTIHTRHAAPITTEQIEQAMMSAMSCMIAIIPPFK